MCGLIAVLGKFGQQVSMQRLEAATRALKHRGPDDIGFYQTENVGFGFHRLSIIDLSSAAHQPMSDISGELTVVFNGEIYNYVELRAELIALGHAFRSHSDTEVLLAAYRQWGNDCVRRFNGMFAFVIHDRSSDLLFAARDRLGVKPLYLWQDDNWLVLASEPAAIGAFGMCELQADWPRLAEAICWGLMDHDNGTCFSGIHAVPAGNSLNIDARGKLAQCSYWTLPPELPTSTFIATEWLDRLAELVTDAVRLRLRSDVPVGFTLSGGIDSSLLICEAGKLHSNGGNHLAFSYQDARHDERQPIADTVAQTGARLHSIGNAELDVTKLLPAVIKANGEPVHSLSALANYALFGLARQHGVKVILGGQGADEIFCGYRDFQWDYWHSLFGDRRWTTLLGDVRAYARLNRRSAAMVYMTTLSRSLRLTFAATSVYRALSASKSSKPRTNPVRALYSPDFLGLAASPEWNPEYFRLDGAQRRAATFWPLPMYLRIEDRVSMAHSVEARLPFTDFRLVEHGLQMPPELKFSGGINKRALRSVASRSVPASVVSRLQKQGFPVSENLTTARGLQTLCKRLVSTTEFSANGIYNHAEVANLIARPAREEDTDALFQLAQTELWLNDLRDKAHCR